MTTDTITISKNALTELLVKFDLLIANTQIKKDRSVEWTANELGRDIKYSYKSLLKLKQ